MTKTTRCKREIQYQRKELETCLRRERLAQAIGDYETARIAREFAGRHQAVMAALQLELESLEQGASSVRPVSARLFENWEREKKAEVRLQELKRSMRR